MKYNDYNDYDRREVHGMANIARIRIQKGLSQQQLANKSGVHRVALAKLEAGERPIENIRLSTALALADALGVDVHDLLN